MPGATRGDILVAIGVVRFHLFFGHLVPVFDLLATATFLARTFEKARNSQGLS